MALAAEICDGWLPMFFSPKADGFYRDALAEGFARPGRPADRRRLRGGLRGAHHRRRRRRGLRRPPPAHARALRRRHGRQGPQLPQGRVRPPRLRGRVREDPGGLPGRPQGRGGRLRAHLDGGGRLPDRPRRRRSATTSRPGARAASPRSSSAARRSSSRRSPRSSRARVARARPAVDRRSSMGQALGKVLPAAAGVALSPVPIIAVILDAGHAARPLQRAGLRGRLDRGPRGGQPARPRRWPAARTIRFRLVDDRRRGDARARARSSW